MDLENISNESSSKEESKNDSENILNDKNEEAEDFSEDEDNPEATQTRAVVKKMKVIDYLKISLFPSITTSLRGIKRIGNTVFIRNGRLLIPKDKIICGKLVQIGWQCHASYIWSTEPPPIGNISLGFMAPYVPGTIGAARDIETELAAFEVYFTEKMLQKIIANTNDEIEISQYYTSPSPKCVYPLSVKELRAFIGILYLLAVKNDELVSKSCLWGASGNDIFTIVISEERFQYLNRCLRFDEYTSRERNNRNDSFGQIRDFWNEFITKCSEVFRPSVNCTIDDIVVEFNGKFKFKVPMPYQPQKYGIKLLLLSDSHNRYIMSGIPYLDKNNDGPVPLPEHLVERLTKPIHGTNINITYGSNWSTSVPITNNMLNLYKLTTVGSIDKQHQEIPPDVVVTERRPVGTSIFLYNNEDGLQLCTHCPKRGEVNVLLSNIHFKSVIKGPEGKPEVVEHYESTKDGVKIINKMMNNYSCSRQTTNWFVAIFYTILDIAGINSMTIFNMNRSRYGMPPIRRVKFLYKLALDLMLPYLNDRLIDPKTSDSIKNKIGQIIKERQNLNVSKQKYTVQQIIDMYPPSQSYKSVAQVIAEQNATANIEKNTEKQTQALHPATQSSTKAITKETPTKATSQLGSDWDIIKSLYDSKNCTKPAQASVSLLSKQQNPQALVINHVQSMHPSIQLNMPIIPFQAALTTEWFPSSVVVSQIQPLLPALQPLMPLQVFAPFVCTQLQPLNYMYPPTLPAISIQNVSSVMNANQSSANVSVQQIQALYPVIQPAQPILIASSIQNANKENLTKKVKDTCSQPPEQTQRTSTQTTKTKGTITKMQTQPKSLLTQSTKSNLVREAPAGTYTVMLKPFAVCGICNFIGDETILSECSSCSVIVCSVHYDILCTNCFHMEKPGLGAYVVAANRAICQDCGPYGNKKYTQQCYSCMKFLCPSHRWKLCCFCLEQ